MCQLSVVIPTYNRFAQLRFVLEGVGQQTLDYKQFEVIVVSDGSTDGTNEFIQSVQTGFELVAILQQNQGVAAARNRGISAAKGEFILFLDDDVYPAAECFDRHLQNHKKSLEDVVVIGPMLTPPGFKMSPWNLWEQLMLEKQYQDMLSGKWAPSPRQFYTGNSSVKKTLLEEINGFDPEFKRAEDVELAYRLADKGVTFTFDFDAAGYHYAERSFDTWLNIPYQYGRNDVIFAKDKGQNWLLKKIFSEYKQRHLLIRLLTNLCLDYWILSRVVIKFFKKLAELGNWLRLSRVSVAAYSAIFNLRYFQGISDQLGGRQNFFKAV